MAFVLVSRFRGNQEEAHLSELLTHQGEKEVTRGKREAAGVGKGHGILSFKIYVPVSPSHCYFGSVPALQLPSF